MDGIRQLSVKGSHADIGGQIGSAFPSEIAAAVEAFKAKEVALVTYRNSAEGEDLFRDMLAVQERECPDCMAELRAMAEASGVGEGDLLLINMRGTFEAHSGAWDDDSGCSTCTVLNDNVAAFGHNEDGDRCFESSMFLLHASPNGKPSFTACVYPSVLPGNAFGFNDRGICYSINNLFPLERKVGVARCLIARSLLEAESIEAAVACVTRKDRASAFNYTIGSIHERRIVDVEAGPYSYAVKEVRGGYFHANHFIELATIPQCFRTSSTCRFDTWRGIRSAGELSAKEDILDVLGNASNSKYPVFRTLPSVDDQMTLTTALFDLDARTLHILKGEAEGMFKEELCLDLPGGSC